MILTSVIFVGLRPRPCSFASAGLVIVFSAAVAWGGADVPPAGGLQALPQMRPEAVSLVNGGFEDGADGWRIGGGAAFGVSETGSRTGKACLGFDAGAPSRYTPSVRQALEGITPGVYVLRFRVKLSGIKPPQRGLGGVRVSIEYQLQGGTRARGATKVFSGTSGWQEAELKVLLPADMEGQAATVSIHRYGKPAAGKARFDDFTLHRLREPPVEAFLRYPNWRGYLAADAPQTVRLSVRVNDGEPAGPARVEVTDAAGKKVAAAELPAGKTEGVVELDAAKWPIGRYSLVARLGGYAHPAYVVQKIAPARRRGMAVWFDRHNVLHAAGRPVFPIGFYNTMRKFGVVDDSEPPRLDRMAEAGANFNINYWWWPCGMKTRQGYLAEMHKRGIRYLDTLMPFRPGKSGYSPGEFDVVNELLPGAGGRLDTQDKCDRFLTALAGRMRALRGHGGWYVMDERPFDCVPAIFHQYTVLRAADPDHPTFGVSNRPGELYRWRDAMDVFGLDPYPLMNMKLGRPLSLAGDQTRVGVEATQGSRAVWTVIQFFQGWSTDRWPTAEELRSMSLMAVVEGARGLFYWSFGARALMSVKDPARKAEYWRRAVTVAREIKSLTPALVAPDAPRAVSSVSDPRIRWRARQAGEKLYVFAYLPARKFTERAAVPPKDVTFTLKDGRTVRRSFRPDTADWFAVAAGH